MSTYPTYDGKPLLDPGVLHRYALEQNLPLDFWGRANSYVCPRGKDPGTAWLLMLRATVNALNYTDFKPLLFRSPQGEVTLGKLRFVRATCMSAGPTTTDTNAAYLLELADKRRWLSMSTAVKQYNVRCPAPPATSGVSLYHSESLNSGALWTWQTMLNDLWLLLPSSLRGTAPTLPYTPNGTPEGFRFLGVSAWESIHQVLDKIGCTTVYNPATDALSIVRTGVAQSGLSSAVSALTNRKLDDLSPVAHASAFVPATVRVLFHKVYKHYGSEPLTHRTGNWSQDPIYQEDIATGIAGAVAGTILPLWDDLPAIVAPSGTVVNSGDLATRATEVAANYINGVTKRANHGHILYSGAVTTIGTGSEVERVIWRDYGDGMGMITEVINRPSALMNGSGSGPSGPSLHLNPPDLSRASFPVYPRDVHLVEVYSDTGADGSAVSPVGNGLFAGKVLRVDVDANTASESVYTTGEDCFLLVVNAGTGSATSSPTLPKGERYFGRLVGSKLVEGLTLPVYAVHEDATGSENDLRVDWAQVGQGGTQNISALGTTVNYSGGATSAAEGVCSFDLSAGTIRVAEDGYVQITFFGNLRPASNYGTFTDVWQVTLRNTPGSSQLHGWFKVDMSETNFGTPVFLKWDLALPNGSSVPIDLFVQIRNMSSSTRDAIIENNTKFTVTWMNRPD